MSHSSRGGRLRWGAGEVGSSFFPRPPRKRKNEDLEKSSRLIQKIYEVDLLMCPKCQERMKIITFIEDEEAIEKTLKHLELWEMKARLPPRAKTPSVTIYLDNLDSQISFPDFFYADPDYPTNSNSISKPHGVTPMVTVSAIKLLS